MPQELALKWLSDAHGMEEAVIQILEKQQTRLENYPEMRAKVSEHLRESRWQAEQLEKQLERFNRSASSLKDIAMNMQGNMFGWLHTPFQDEVIKDNLLNYATEHYEIMCYESLIITFQTIHEPDVVRVCEEILQQEKNMAEWIRQYSPKLMREFLSRVDSAVSSEKR